MVKQKASGISKYFCNYLSIGNKKEPIKITKKEFTKPSLLKLRKIENKEYTYGFYVFERIFFKTGANIVLKSERLNESKIYFLNAKFVSLIELEIEASAEAAAEPWTTDDARNALKNLKSGKYKQVIQCLNTQYFFEFNPEKHELL
jgi:hypothetical protein